MLIQWLGWSVCMYESMYVWKYVCMKVCMYESMYVWKYVCMHESMYVCMKVCMYETLSSFYLYLLKNPLKLNQTLHEYQYRVNML